MAGRERAPGNRLSTLLARGSAGLEREAPPGSLVDLVYQNEEGRVSRRRVEIVHWSPGRNGFTYLRGYCFLREEERTFRADRIVEWQVVARDGPAQPRPAVVFVSIELPRTPGDTAPVAAAPAVPPRKRGRCLLTMLGAAAAVMVLRGLFTTAEPPEPPYVPAPARAVAAPVPGRDVPDERALAFRAATGIASPRLEAMYRGADHDGNDALDWDELSAFQSRLDRTFAYRSNELALRPDQFLAQGGGDCEDWALFSCGLLRFWGWDPWIGSFAPSERTVGHAVCLVRVRESPSRFRAWSVDGDGMLGGYSVKSGQYVPVDYGHVGGLSNAVGEDWRLRAIWKPEAIYGEQM